MSVSWRAYLNTIIAPVHTRIQTLTSDLSYILHNVCFNWATSNKAPLCFLCYFDTFSATGANVAKLPKNNLLIPPLEALTGIRRWGCGGLQLEESGRGPDVKFRIKSKDELEKNRKLPFQPCYRLEAIILTSVNVPNVVIVQQTTSQTAKK